MNLDYDTYFEYHDQSYQVIEKVANYYGLELKDLRWDHYRDYAIDVENIKIVPYGFGHISSKLLSANILKMGDAVGISYNTSMVDGRQRFSILHEIGHFFFDLNQEEYRQGFSELLNGSGYSEEDMPREQRANVFASLAMANNEAIKDCLKSGMSFSKMCNEFQLSNAALYVRLFDFLTKLFMLNPNIARQTLNNYRYAGDNSKIIEIIRMGL
ncbi:ImmA/IrrE family metallo-endopeptidase [Candidatus Enterococcus mansonii]|uniref:IrrE N-terminal-like domain-containing protein n=1 Tax=Candidatus Enterococcus mansonii TaxID=1834181 RepID=A0A242CH91_9ENTE|nr:ImmA/IrrE family metallo-endopeptidase [Enterococcus sp. 4G2_DIV0659]OTO09586.1 hypothetical protein A5880_000265 [Enterococcus sp. 4G2_DIV0659]